MSEVGKLWVSITAKTDEFNKNLQGVQQKMRNVGGSLMSTGGMLTKGVTLPLIAAGGAALGLVSKMATAGDEIQKAALRTGFSTEALSEYKHAAELSGASIESVEKAVKRMQKNLLDAENGMSTATRGLDNLGLSLDELQQMSPEDQFNTIAMALAEIEDPSLRAAMAQEVFGRAGTELLPMLADGAEGLEAMRQEAHDLGIVFDQEAADAAAKFNDDMDRLKKGLGGAFRELGMKLMPIMNDFVNVLRENLVPWVSQLADKISDLVDWWQNLSPGVQKFIGVALGLVVVLGPILMILGALITAIAAILSPIGLVIIAIIALVAIFVYLWNTNENFRNAVIAIWEAIKAAAIAIWEGLKAFFTATADFIKGIWDKHGDNITAIFSAIWDQIKNIFETAVKVIEGIVKFITSVIKGDWEGAWSAVKDIVKAGIDFVQRTIQNVSQYLSGIWGMIRSSVTSAWAAIVGAITSRANQIRTSITNAFNNALAYIRGLPGQMVSMGRNIIQGLINGIKNMAGALSGAIQSAIKGGIDKAKSFLGIKSPSKIFEGMGINVGEGFINGIENMKGLVSTSMQGMVSPQLSLSAPGMNGGGSSMTIRHEIDLRNVPATVDGASLEGRLMDMLNNPQVKRRFDRMSFENQQSATRGLGQ